MPLEQPYAFAQSQIQDTGGNDASLVNGMDSMGLFCALEKILGVMNNIQKQVEEHGATLKRMGVSIEDLTNKWKDLSDRLDTPYHALQLDSPITPDESASQVGPRAASLPTSKNGNGTTSASASASESSFPALVPPEQPSTRPNGYPVNILWTLYDAWDDEIANVPPDNRYRPSMRKCVRNKDGTLINANQWRNIRTSVNVVYRTFLKPLVNCETQALLDKLPIKKYFTISHETTWDNAVFALEAREPLLRLCANHWKAEHVLCRKLESTARGAKTEKRKGKDDGGMGVSEDEEDEAHIVTKNGKRAADPMETTASSRMRQKKKTYHGSN